MKIESRAEKIQEYGKERLPSGDISGDELIVVEGRADVINLLKNRVNNVIGMDGAKFPKSIAELGKTKEITLFIDGDRGGKLIAKNVVDNARVAYICSAPDGKEVEELTGKEKEDIDRVLDDVKVVGKEFGFNVELLLAKKVKSYGPKIDHYVFDFMVEKI